MYFFRIERRLSTALHPQTDGQTRRQKSVLERYFRSYVNYLQDDWATLLALAKFAYNASVHSLTGRAPFEIVYGEVPRSDILTLDEVQKYIAPWASSVEVKAWLREYIPPAMKSQNLLRLHKLIKFANTTNPIAM